VQIFWQENFSTILQSYPKQKCKSLIFSNLHFKKTLKVVQNKKFSTIRCSTF